MERKLKILKSKKEIDQLILTYFSIVNEVDLKRALSLFKQRKGYGVKIVFTSFQSDLEAQLPKPIDDKHVLIKLGYPAVDIDNLAYLDFHRSSMIRWEPLHENEQLSENDIQSIIEQVTQSVNENTVQILFE